MKDAEIVWLHEYRCFAFLNVRNATDSMVTFITDNGWVTDWVENDEYEFWEERNIDYESD